MRCRKAERLLHLYAEGERDDRERSELERHLATCEACSRLAASMGAFSDTVAGLRSSEPVLDDPGTLTARIMAAVEADGRSYPRRSAERADARVWTRRLSLRPAAVGALALIVLALGIQEFLLLNRIARLEARMASIGSAAAVESAAAPAGGILERDLAAWTAPAMLGTGILPSRIPNDLIVVRRSELIRLLASVSGSEADPGTVEEMLTRRFPELGTITLADGLSGNEARRLLAYRTEILDALRRL